MASKAKMVAPPTPRAARTMTLGFGPMAFQVGLAPLRNAGNGPEGHYVCPEHRTQLKQSWSCEGGGKPHVTEDRVRGWKYGEQFVVFEPDELKDLEDESNPVVSLTHAAETIDPVWYEKSYLLWPRDEGPSAGAYDILATALQASGTVLMGTVKLWRKTQLVAVRWSDATATLVAHICAFDEQMRWNDVASVATGMVVRAEPDKAMVDLCTSFIGTLESGMPELRDEYAERLTKAIEAKATGGIFEPAPKPEEFTPQQLEAMMDALRAEVAKHSKKPAAKRSTRKARA